MIGIEERDKRQVYPILTDYLESKYVVIGHRVYPSQISVILYQLADGWEQDGYREDRVCALSLSNYNALALKQVGEIEVERIKRFLLKAKIMGQLSEDIISKENLIDELLGLDREIYYDLVFSLRCYLKDDSIFEKFVAKEVEEGVIYANYVTKNRVIYIGDGDYIRLRSRNKFEKELKRKLIERDYIEKEEDKSKLIVANRDFIAKVLVNEYK